MQFAGDVPPLLKAGGRRRYRAATRASTRNSKLVMATKAAAAKNVMLLGWAATSDYQEKGNNDARG